VALLTQPIPDGTTTALASPGGTIEYRYTAVNLLAALVQPGGATTSYGYDADNNRTATTHPNGVVVTHAYNATSPPSPRPRPPVCT
jgi:YD repeat-containing protein